MRCRTTVAAVALGASSVLFLAGCAGGAADAGEQGGKLQVLASTDVYGQIAEEVGGDLVEVTALVSSAGQDPHGYEASAQDQLALTRADLIVENGGGYDAFVDALVASSGSAAPVITAVEYSPSFPGNEDHDKDSAGSAPEPGSASDDHASDDQNHIEGFNEHVWYDPSTIEHVAEAIAEQLGALDPDNADTFTGRAATFTDGIHGLEASLAAIQATDAGAAVFATEPVPGYLLEAAALRDVTPPAFSEAVEEGQDVPPATLLEALQLLDDGEVRVLIANAQTGGAETTQVIDAAEAKAIPVLEFTETLPDGQTYVQWMQQNIAGLAAALS